MKLNENNRGAIALKTMIFLVLLGYGTFVGYKLTMTYFTKGSIETEAREMINRIKGPSVYSDEGAEKLLIKVLKNNNVYESDKINPVFASKTDDGQYVDYELTYKIRTELILFETDWETIKIKKRSEVANRM